MRTYHSPIPALLPESIIDPDPLLVASDVRLSEVLNLIQEEAVLNSSDVTGTVLARRPSTSCFLVMESAHLVGVLTQTNVQRFLDRGIDPSTVSAADAMSCPVITLTQSKFQDCFAVLSLLRRHQINYLPVLNDSEQPVGVIHRATLLEALANWGCNLHSAEETTETIQALQQTLQECVIELNGVQAELQRETAKRQQAEAAWRSPCDRPNPSISHTLPGVSSLPEEKQLELSQTSEQSDRERLINEIAQRIRQSLNLEEILNTTVREVQHLLQADRVGLYRFRQPVTQEQISSTPTGWSGWHGSMVIEACSSGWDSILGFQIHDPLTSEEQYIQRYLQRDVCAIADIHTANLEPATVELLTFFQVKGMLVVPILQGEELWGLLIVHQCSAPRQWRSWEINLLKQLTTQVEIAIQQAELYHQVKQLNLSLEAQVQERTTQLQQALELEATLKRITDKVRDSLDEKHILQTAVQELSSVIGTGSCCAALYDLNGDTAIICYDHCKLDASTQRQLEQMTDLNDFHAQLLQGQCFQFCEFSPYLNRGQEAILVCPIFDNQEVLGDLRLYAQRGHAFNELEIRLVQQVANQGAIAVRQARLYQASQAQVKELEKLNSLKDDFLSTVSHELRTPLSSIKLATQMLELAFKAGKEAGLEQPIQPHSHPFTKADRYLKILREECDREINLINDVLMLQQIEAGIHPFLPTTIRLQDWLPQIANLFEEEARSHQQHLQVKVLPELPPLVTDLFMLDRILEELLTNACKFTPTKESITLTARAKSKAMQISICNSGVEIPANEQSQIFDKFYRIPSIDPWKLGGTGLGLALVKKLTERLGGSIWVESVDGSTCFTVEIPGH